MNPSVGRFSPVHYWQWTGKGYVPNRVQGGTGREYTCYGCSTKRGKGTLDERWGTLRNSQRVRLAPDGIGISAKQGKSTWYPMGYSTNTGKGYGWYQMGQQHENGERVPLQPDEDGIGYRVQVQLARDREDKKVSGGTSLGCTRPGRGTRDT